MAVMVHPWDMMGKETDDQVLAAVAGRNARPKRRGRLAP